MYRLILDFAGLLASLITIAGFVREEWPRFQRRLRRKSTPTDGSEDLH